MNEKTIRIGLDEDDKVVDLEKACVFRSKSAGLSEQTGRPFGVK